MAAKQDNDSNLDNIKDEMDDDNNDIDSLLESMEASGNGQIDATLTARRRIEDLLEERRLRDQIGDVMDLE